MKFLVDRCAGRLIAEWLRERGHDVVEARDRVPDPGDRALLEWATSESRILITIDNDFGKLIYHEDQPHSGLIRLPDVPAEERLYLMGELLERFTSDLTSAAIVTIRGGRIRISKAISNE